jgi:secreted trypsin-like serine protease
MGKVFCLVMVLLSGILAQAKLHRPSDWIPLVNGGESVSAEDPIRRSTVMLETDAQYCSATIIGENLLLTAAHCLPESGTWMQIHFDGLEGSVTRDASRFVRHENYQDLQETTRNDVALIFFGGGLPPGFESVSIRTPEQGLSVGDQLQVAGYGGGSPQGALAKISLTVSELMTPQKLIKFTQSKAKGICHGDSGGPAYVTAQGRLLLTGVASYVGDYDCSGYSVYTNATEFTSWISGKIVLFEQGLL